MHRMTMFRFATVLGVFGLFLFVAGLTPHQVRAVAGDGATSNIRLLDTDEDGYPNRITFDIANPNGETWTRTGASPYGLSVTQGGAAITISSVTLTTAATANPVGIQVDLDTGDADLVQNTDGVNDSPIELIYTQQTGDQTCTTCLTDTVDEELNTMATGDSGATNTETDHMNPVLTAARVTLSSTVGLDFNTIALDYTERMFISLDGDGGVDLSRAGTLLGASTATVGAMTTARTLAGLGSWGAGSGGDLVTSGATVNEVVTEVGQNSVDVIMNFSSAGYFSAGSVAPTTATFTPVANALILFDAAGNAQTTNPVTMSVTAGWDVTAPTVANTYSCDPSLTGKIQRMQVNFSEEIFDSALAVGILEADNDTTNDGTGEETAASLSTETGGCDGAANDTDTNDEKMRFDVTTGIAGTDLAYFNYTGNTSNFVRDGAGNRLVNGAALGTENDKAVPLLSASTPVDGATSVSRSGSIVLTFTEPMDTGSFSGSLSSFSGTFTSAWASGSNGSNSVLTLSHAAQFVSGSHTYTIAAAPDVSANAFGGATSTADEPFSFRVRAASSSSGSSSGSVTSTTPTITLDDVSPAPVGGEEETLAWTIGGSGARTIHLDYSLDEGDTYIDIIDNLSTTETSYVWTVPVVLTADAIVRARVLDSGKAVIATDTTEPFAIVMLASSSTDAEDEETDTETDSDTSCPLATSADFTKDAWGNRWANDADEQGVSPFDGSTENISSVVCGWFVRGEHYATVYYLAADGTRRAFWNAATFLTYGGDWSDVVWVTDATLATMRLGQPMLPKAGTVFVKTPSSPSVYWVTDDGSGPVLHNIRSEEDARSAFGSAWADSVIDLDASQFTHYTHGDDFDPSESVDVSAMRSRSSLFE